MEAHKQKVKALEKMAADYLNDADKKKRERIALENARIAILTNPQTGAKVELQRVLAALDVNAKELRDIDAAVHATSEEMRETQNRITKLETDKAQKDAERENETIQEKINTLWANELKRRAEARAVAHKLTSRFWELARSCDTGNPSRGKLSG